MTPRLKKLLGLFILLPGIAVYIAGAITLADFVPDFWLLKLIYFVCAGIAWAPPAHLLMRWMEAAPSDEKK